MDREKVIKGIHQHCEGPMFDRCGECPYYDAMDEPFICRDMLLNDLNTLLKEQEAVEPFHKCIGKGFSLIEDSHFDYCPYCGKPITWAKQKGR